MRRASRTDANQISLTMLYRKLGCSVAITSSVGTGFPDIVVGVAGKTSLVEIKDPSQPPSKRKLTPDQVLFHRNWKGSIIIIETEQDVINHVDRLKTDDV